MVFVHKYERVKNALANSFLLNILVKILHQDEGVSILSVNEKLPLLKFDILKIIKGIWTVTFTFRVSGQLQTRLEQ